MHTIGTATLEKTQPSRSDIDTFAKKAQNIKQHIANLVQAAKEHLATAKRAREVRDELRQKYENYFDEQSPIRFITTLLIGFILFAIYCLDVFLIRQPVEFLVGTFLGEIASKVAVLLVPAAIMGLEIWAGSRLHEAFAAWRAGDHGIGPVIEWALIAAIGALAVPTAVIVTYIAADLTGGLSLLVIFQLALALLCHLGLVCGASIIMEHASWAIVRFRHWRWNRTAIHEERTAERLLAKAQRTVMELQHHFERAARHGVELTLGAIPQLVREFLQAHFPGQFDLPLQPHPVEPLVVLLPPNSSQNGHIMRDFVPR